MIQIVLRHGATAVWMGAPLALIGMAMIRRRNPLCRDVAWFPMNVAQGKRVQ